MATSTAARGEALVPGVGADGSLPLPWLAPALDRAAQLRHAHALLAHGPAGAGHLEFALVLAQGWLCESTDAASAKPCGGCAGCQLVRARTHADLLVLLPDAQRVRLGWVGDDEGSLGKADAKPSRDIRVEQVRQAIDWSHQTSGRGRGKVLVVHPADALNGPAANALLKTLEEPAGGLRLLLTSDDPERLLPTVRSRCQRLPLALPPAEQALTWLRARGLDDAAPLLALAGGSPLQALQAATEGVDAALLSALPRRVAAGDAGVLAGLGLPRAIELLQKLAHDLLSVAAGGAPRFYPAGTLPPAPAIAGLVDWQRALLRAARHDEHPWNAGLLLESLVTQATPLWPRSPAPRASGVRAPLHSQP